jgi:hypothetical protein
MMHETLTQRPDPTSLLLAAARLVAADQNAGTWRGEDDWMPIRYACMNARNVLRLPEDEWTSGSYPLDDDGSQLARAYRIILEASESTIASLPETDEFGDFDLTVARWRRDNTHHLRRLAQEDLGRAQRAVEDARLIEAAAAVLYQAAVEDQEREAKK